MPYLPAMPSVLLLYCDQLRFDALGCAAGDAGARCPGVQTPVLDGLARHGTRFTRCHVQHPLCMPSRLSMLTGKYPATLGVTHMGVPVPEDTEHLATHLGRRGYRTANLGKLHFLPHSNRDHRLPHPAYGFDHAEISDEPGCYRDDFVAWVERHHPESLDAVSVIADPPAAQIWRDLLEFDDGLTRDTPAATDAYRPRVFAGSEDATHTAWVADRTRDYLAARGRDGDPFLCIAGFYNPHPPLVAPQRFLDLYDPDTIELPAFSADEQAAIDAAGVTEEQLRLARQGYYAMVTELDHHVGRILQGLDAAGRMDDTVIVFTSDHGEFLGELGQWGKWHPAPDCVSRVPLIMAGPGIAHGTCDAIVEQVDVLPTLMHELGLQAVPDLQGRRLTAALRGASIADADALMESSQWKMLRTDQWRYLRHVDGRETLYAESTPGGTATDLASERPEVIAEHRNRLLTKLQSIERPRYRPWTY